MKTAIITGAAKGIGRETALRFARAGANIVLNYRSEKPEALAAEIESLGAGCLPFKADVSIFSEAGVLIQAAKENFGTVDYLVNNAGVTRDNLIVRMSEEEFDAVIATNLKGAFNTIKHAAGFMLKQRSGAIVNLSSVVGLFGNAGQTNYSASKAGIIGLTKSAARELASRGITVNAVAPGFIQTDMTETLPESLKEKMLERIPLKRLGKPAEVAEVVYFAANCAYMTGQVISIDGGM